MNKTNTIIIIVTEAILFCLFFGFILVSKNDDINRLDQNLKASKSQIEQLELKNGDLISSRDLYIAKESELTSILDITKQEVKDLKKKLGSSLTYISDIQSKIEFDTIEVIKDSIIYISPNSIKNKFEYTNEWVDIGGESIVDLKDSVSQTSINKLDINVPLRTGLTDNYKIFIQSDNPYINFTSIEGAVLDKSKLNKKQRWSHGIHFGVGVQYGILNKQFDIGPQLGYSLHFNF